MDRVCVAAFVILWTLMFVRIAPSILRSDTWPIALVGLLAGYLLADFLAGAAHWIADRFFDPATPLLGPLLIEPFRAHHEDSLDITRHDFFEVSGNNALVTLPVVLLVAAMPQPDVWPAQLLATTGASLTLALFATNQFHSWAHSKAPPPLIHWLHRSGLILTPKRHARHHRAKHDCAYCVTSGWLNPALDRMRVFERLERLFHAGPQQNRRSI